MENPTPSFKYFRVFWLCLLLVRKWFQLQLFCDWFISDYSWISKCIDYRLCKIYRQLPKVKWNAGYKTVNTYKKQNSMKK